MVLSRVLRMLVLGTRLFWMVCTKRHLTVDGLLSEARKLLPRRFSPLEVHEAVQNGKALLVDLRYLEQILRDGVIPGAVRLHSNEVFWRLHPDCPFKDKHIRQGDYEQVIILLCNQGYSSSLFAAVFQLFFGMSKVFDVDGGFEAWSKDGLPVAKYTADSN